MITSLRRHALLLCFAAVAVPSTTTGVAAAESSDACPSGSRVVPAAIFTVDTTGMPQGLPTEQVVKLFADAGITLTWAPAESPVTIIADSEDYGGVGMQGDPIAATLGFHNLIKQDNGYPVSFTLTFANPVLDVRFRRAAMVAGPSGVTHPPWTATATGEDGTIVATTGDAEIRSFANVPARAFELASSARIKAVTFNGNDHGFDGQANVVIDHLSWCP